MKWIGQHIWSFISRFRSDVYLEDISNADADKDQFLVRDGNDGKVYYRTGAEVLSDIGASSESTDLEFNGSTANGILTYGGAAQIDVESTFTYDSGLHTTMMSSSSAGSFPYFLMTNSHTDGAASLFKFEKTANGADDDYLGTIVWNGDDTLGGAQTFAKIAVQIETALATDEAGKLFLQVAASDGGSPSGSALQQALTATGHGTANTVDIGLGYGATSTTTIAGDLTVTSGLTIGSHKFDDIDIGSEFVDTDDHIMSSGAIKEKIESYGYTTNTGDITGVTIITDSGGGSAASDTSGSADFSILGSSGVGVTNSGTTITAVSVPGEIDHDSLLNFVAAEHYRWDTDISSTATINAANITDLHGAGVDGSANQLLTDNGDGTVTSESTLGYDSETLSVGAADAGGSTIKRTGSVAAGGELRVYGGAAAGSDAEGGDLILWGGSSTGSANSGDVILVTNRTSDTSPSTSNTGGDHYLKLHGNAGAVAILALNTNVSMKFDTAQHGIYFEGGSYDTFLRAQTTATAARTITLPDATGTVALTNDLPLGWHGSATRIKILHSDFIADDGGRPVMIDDTGVGSENLFLESFGTFFAYATIAIPTGHTATHVMVYGTNTPAVEVWEHQINNLIGVSKGTGNVGTEIDITDVTSTTTNYLFIQVAQASGDEIHGGYVTIATV